MSYPGVCRIQRITLNKGMSSTRGSPYSGLGGKILFVCLSWAPALGWSTAENEVLARSPDSFADLSIEELANIEIISVSKKPEKLSEAAAAVFVITHEEIRRSGATSIPEALRLAPNLQVARVDSSQYAISARGFNSTTANKLLVLIDGRSVYTPLFSGVFWDVQDTLLEDIERIEVISGPGATLWGANAVNGVINIITRSARDTEGTLLTGGGGNEERAFAGFRHGGKLSDNASYRVYGKYFERDSTVLASGTSVPDAWHKGQGGFRIDWSSTADTLTLQGDAYKGAIDQATFNDKIIEGANLLARWEHSWAKDSNLQLQVYYDHTERDFPGLFAEIRNTFDIDLQHRFKFSERHEIVWGGGHRSSRDDVRNSPGLAFLPERRDLNLVNLFVQDSIALLKNRLQLTLGSKFEHNDYTGFEAQPSARLSWKPYEEQLLWAAVSRAVRTPSRIDRDLFVPASPPFLLAGGPDFQSETVVAYELGYRVQPHARVSLSLSTFYNDYKHLRSLEPVPGTSALVLANRMEGETYGAELWADIKLTDSWRLKPGYAFLHKDLRLPSGSGDPSIAGNDAKHRFLLRSAMDLTPKLEFDWTLSHVSSLPSPAVPAYTTLDLRLGWKQSKQLEVSLIGQNLLDKRHPEFGLASTRSEIERSVLVKAVLKF
jgi:iron complex outermembrane receptor protein